MTHRQAMTLGAVLGVTFTVGAAVADVIVQRRKPRTPWFNNPDDFLNSLNKSE